jgi:hypothetical protein
MPIFRRTVALPVPPDAVFAWHVRPGALERLLPPWSGITVERQPPEGLADGSRAVLRMPIGPFRLPWVALHYGTIPGKQFGDEQLEGPFHSWHHMHRMEPAPDGSGCVLEDDVRYALSWGMGAFGLSQRVIERSLHRTFAFRHERIRADLLRHQRFAQHAPRRIAVTGAGGLLGRRLVPFLRGGGHTVMRLVRSGNDRARDAVRWDPLSGAVDIERLGNVDAVIHLAGENIAGGRWTVQRKGEIRTSRVDATKELCKTLAALAKPPRVFVSASGAGYYGNRPEGTVTEADGPGHGFLSNVCRAWEAATEPLHATGARIVQLRLGLVVAAEGGAVRSMLLPFRLGLGGRLGSGRQGMPWISAEDAIGIAHQALFDERLSGPVNAVAPQPTTNRDFTRALAKVLKRPAILPVPGLLVRLALGELGRALLLEGAVVSPTRLQAIAFPYLHTDLAAALRCELGIFPAQR